MDLQFSPDDRAFQVEVRQFLVDNLPASVRERSERGLHPAKNEIVAWQKKLWRKGWIAPNWPKEYGGTGWSLTRKYIYNREYFLAGAPQVIPFGIGMVGPVIYTFGSPEQKARYLDDILQSNTWWCQGYSEPNAGSDLASLKTRAVRDGDHYVVTGQKIWTSFAHLADMIFCLVRTDPAAKPQEGITFLLIDMQSPGIEVRPIIGLDGEHTLNEVFFDEVRVPVENRVGEENKGWTYAKYLLGHERNMVARVARSQFQLNRLKRIAADQACDGGDIRRRIAQIETELMALEALELRYLSQEIAGDMPGAGPSLLKLRGAEIAQAIKTLTVEVLGPYGAVFLTDDAVRGRNDGPVGPDYAHGALGDHLYQRAATIYGGSNEIQRNIIAKQLLR